MKLKHYISNIRVPSRDTVESTVHRITRKYTKKDIGRYIIGGGLSGLVGLLNLPLGVATLTTFIAYDVIDKHKSCDTEDLINLIKENPTFREQITKHIQGE